MSKKLIVSQQGICILIFDAHEIYRDALAEWLEASCDIIIIGTTGNKEELLHFLNNENQPDVIIIGATRGDREESLIIVEEILKVLPVAKIIGLSTFYTVHFCNQMKEQGVKGFILKAMKHEEILHAIREVYKGQTIFKKEKFCLALS
jgi:two-component system, NarL family, response regulator NreC